MTPQEVYNGSEILGKLFRTIYRFKIVKNQRYLWERPTNSYVRKWTPNV